jgi:integrase
MTLADLLTTLVTRSALPASRAKDIKTSLRYLATALGHASLEQCPVDAASQEADTWQAALEAHFQALTAQGRTISAATRRNTRNNVRVLFRLAETQGLLAAPLPVPLLTKPRREDFRRQQLATQPYPTTYGSQGKGGYWLPQAQWPADIVQGWREYQTRCGLRLRKTTFQTYAKRIATYLGYILQVGGRPPTWDDVFDVASLAEFVRWHAARVGRPISVHGVSVVETATAMARVLGHPHAQALTDLYKTLPTPEPVHVKRAHWVSLAQLEAIAEACLHEGRVPLSVSRATRQLGAVRASQFQKGVILKLLVRVPLRQRNVRELRRGEHLYQDQKGHWQLHFQGGDLKVAARGGRVNEYNVNLTEYAPEFVSLLEEFLTVHRPRLPGATTSPFLFLTNHGGPFSQQTLRVELAETVAMRTGQRFYPHLIRSIWATEYLEQTQDFTTAAVLLGDTLKVVMQTYYDVVTRDHHVKARAFLGTALHPGPLRAPRGS